MIFSICYNILIINDLCLNCWKNKSTGFCVFDYFDNMRILFIQNVTQQSPDVI